MKILQDLLYLQYICSCKILTKLFQDLAKSSSGLQYIKFCKMSPKSGQNLTKSFAFAYMFLKGFHKELIKKL